MDLTIFHNKTLALVLIHTWRIFHPATGGLLHVQVTWDATVERLVTRLCGIKKNIYLFSSILDQEADVMCCRLPHDGEPGLLHPGLGL